MAPGRKRRAEVAPESSNEQSEDEGPRSTQRRRQNQPVEEEEEEYTQNGAEEPTVIDAADGDEEEVGRDPRGTYGLVMKLVRYALACEFGRVPIRREGIREKVFGKHGGRRFQQLFDEAQVLLEEKFGMQMVELPSKEKVTLKDRRAAVQKAAATSTNRSYILKSILPQKYNIPAIITPSHIPSASAESAYMGLYTLIVSIIMLNGGRVSDEKLMRYLQRMNANVNTPVDKTEFLFAKMQKQGYVVKIKDNASGTDITEWMVGPRGKVEVGAEGVKGLVKTVYGDTAPDDLDVRLKASLGIKDGPERRERQVVEPEGEEQGRAGRRTRAAEAEEE
ncbi:hypothetical protein VC83_00037 [Pseudogymnoascus destructans]|uniref:MAGE domain-containing protein n=2 Tax=Pseudogymnoascus destructans TaxID=655981 RepID=L8G3X5_PSED2|nr:uncharacterized protein VC83_00037 [Pseudogymnoascus destructans]ELR07980.1 hypothetical protein GMDG_02838 [Pseudogymnoascus destructans 20631-21]OAF62908.1 hypothetical protein VC83_00037 [Pseudogymnoascus destructans]